MATRARVDKTFLSITVLLAGAGFLIFSSASLALLAKESSNYSSIAFSQTVLGLLAGSVALVIASRLDYKIWKKFAFYLLLFAIILNIAVLIPGVGFAHAGARRWLEVGGFSFQPSEVLKLGFIIYFAAWCSAVKDKIKTFSWGLMPFIIMLSIAGVLLLKQPDYDTLLVLAVTGIAMFVAAGARWKDILLLAIVGTIAISFKIYATPYAMQRIKTFFHPMENTLGAGWQSQQSLIAVGSGGLFGRGFGQSVQKFTYLPEPVGDSVFAVAAEELGFIGAVILVGLFVLFATRGLKIASGAANPFARLVVVGIVIMIISQAFVNIGAMLGVVPLSGITLPFVSQGGTSLFFTLLEAGIVLSISRF
ncbi:MAG: putative lipid II flippase FtsW [Candidatus Zambryskibacteria bacterium]|nr:putative lipid II flippase FtsW [Candidatus Zambryskibacteria bacterium]